MIKTFQDLDIMHHQISLSKSITIILTFIYSFFHAIIGPILNHVSFGTLMLLICMDTVLGAVKAKKSNFFRFKILKDRFLQKTSMYMIFTAIGILVSQAPSSFIVLPFVSFVFTSMIVKEAASALRTTSELFSNKQIGQASAYAEGLADGLFKPKKEKEDTPEI